MYPVWKTLKRKVSDFILNVTSWGQKQNSVGKTSTAPDPASSWSSVCEGRQEHGALRLPHGPQTPARDTKTHRERDRTREKHLWWAPKRSNCVTVGEFMSSEVIPIKHSVSISSRRNKWTASVISGYVSVLTKDTIKHTFDSGGIYKDRKLKTRVTC